MPSSNIQHKTPGGRSRRRKAAVPSMTTADDENDGKENQQQSSSSRSLMADYFLDDNDDDLPSFQVIKQSSENHKEREKTLQKEACHQFRQSLKRVSVQSSSKLWDASQIRMVDSVMSASLTKKGNANGTFLLLDEYKSELLGFARKLIKAVAATTVEENSSSMTTAVVIGDDNLFVAVHILRAVAFVLADSISVEKRESLLKLFYHLITTAGEKAMVRSNTDADAKEMDMAGIRWGFISLAGYEGLGYALSKYSTKETGQRDTTTTVTFELVYDSNGSNKKHLFAVPKRNSSSKSSEHSISSSGGMSIRQLCTIALKTTSILAKTMCNLPDLSRQVVDELIPSLYGSLSTVLDGKMKDGLKLATGMLTAVQDPWLDLLIHVSGNDKEAFKEVLSFAKGGHRILWDAASKLKSGQLTGFSNSVAVEDECFELRMHAILLLLPEISEVKASKVIRRSSLDTALTYAWKAATVYHQNAANEASSNQLTSFYSVLDKRVEYFLQLDSGYTPAYIEYFAYKSVHLTPPSSFSLDTETTSDKVTPETNFRVLLDILRITAWCRWRLTTMTSVESRKRRTESDENSDSTAVATMLILITEFQAQFLDASTSADTLKHVYKIFGILAIQKSLFSALKADHSALPAISSELQIGSMFLQCMGRIGLQLFRLASGKPSQMLDMIIECHVRPISVYEKLSAAFDAKQDSASSQKYISLSDAHCTMYHDVALELCSTGIPPNVTEKAAKLLAVTSRHRTERSVHEASILPMLLSVRLYLNIDCNSANETNTQLTQRFVMLSTVFDTVENPDESFFSLCMALIHEIRQDEVFNTPLKETDVLAFLANRCDGVFPPTPDAPRLSQKSSSICRRLASMLFDHPILLEAPRSGTTDVLGLKLISWMDHLTDCIQNCDASAISPSSAIESLLSPCKEEADERDTMVLFLAVVEIATHLGVSINYMTDDSSENDMPSNTNFDTILSLLHEAVGMLNLQCEETVKDLLDVLKVVSKKLLGQKRWTNADPIVLSDVEVSFLNGACRSSDYSALLSEGMQLVKLSLLLAAGMLNIDDIFDSIVGAAKLFLDQNHDESGFHLLAKQWATWAVSNITGRVGLSGNKEKSTILSVWLVALTENDRFFHMWYTSLLLSNCADETNLICLLGASSDERNICQGESTPTEESQWMLEVEMDLCRLHVDLLNTGADSSISYGQRADFLKALYQQLNGFSSTNRERLLQLWVSSTLCLVYSDLAATYGRFPAALVWTQQCLKFCQAIMKQADIRFSDMSSLMEEVVTSSILTRATLRYIQVLSKRPKLHYRLGDYRKADLYMRSVLDFLKVETTCPENKDDRPSQLKQLVRSLNSAPEVRLFLEMASWASTPELIVKELSLDTGFGFFDETLPNSSSIVCDSIQNLIAGGDVLYGESISAVFRNSFLTFYEEAIRRVAENEGLTKFQPVVIPEVAQGVVGMMLSDQIELRKVRLQMESASPLDDDARSTIVELCSSIKASPASYSLDKAWSLYYLGLFELDHAREQGSLQALWNEENMGSDDSPCTCVHLINAKAHLSEASLHTMNASDILTRNILRSLALATGPSRGESIGVSAGILILTSVGQSLRRRMTCSFSNSAEELDASESVERWQHVFSAFDGPSCEDPDRDRGILEFLMQIANLTPSGWSFVAPVICPSGEILVVTLEKRSSSVAFTISTKCIFPTDGVAGYECIMKPFDEIHFRIQEHLQSVDPASLLDHEDKEAVKRRWWEERGRLDEEFRILLDILDTSFFSKVFERKNVAPIGFDDDVPRGNLASRFDNAFDDSSGQLSSSLDERITSLKELTVVKLKKKLLEIGVSESRFKNMKKAELIDLAIDREDELHAETAADDDGIVDSARCSGEECLFLILDENLHRFPFEGLASLEGRTVCRVPCLSFVLATLYDLGVEDGNSPSVNPSNTTYVLDPEENLKGTRSRLKPFLDDVAASHSWNWKGIVGEIPSADFFHRGLMSQGGLLMYFGHGGAQTCFSRRRIEELIDCRVQALQGQDGEGRCQASVVLMGCSSGRLVSINRKNSDSTEETPLYYEPEGVALSYLCAGAPCVVGNLWDVTDNDIDRFSIAFLDHFLGGANLAESVAISRSACKLRYLVGCAPVCYGVPVKPILTKSK